LSIKYYTKNLKIELSVKMKKLFKYIFLFVLFPLWGLGSFGWGAYAQLYPVQLTPVFNSPYSVKLSDYATSMDTKMQLLINPTDISINNRQVRLQFSVQGNGINAKSTNFIQGQNPIFINGGELQTLTNVDISALFRLENLQGITAVQYANPLPEGMYNFCFEMYDFITNQKISQKSCSMLYIILNDPPLLNTPQRNEQIAASDFPNILFTWTPRQINATNVSYTYELKELLDPSLDPQYGFQMAPLLYQETDLHSTAMVYDLGKPNLIPGKRYAWRVRAVSKSGLSENSVFKNDGYSEIYAFKYTGYCQAPTFLLSEAQGPKSVKISWQGVPEHTRYQLQYKKQDVANAQWFSVYSQNTQSLLTDLEAGVTYEFRVGSSCDPATEGRQSFTYSGINTFTTPTQTNGVPAYNCGIMPTISIQNQKPIDNLIVSETFKAGDFPVTILELEGHNPYSGKGYIIVPYLADTKIAVEFNDITINTDYQLINGIIETSYNPDWKNVTDLEDFTGEGEGGQIEKTVPFEVKEVLVNENGDLVVNGVDGQQVTISGGKDTVITDSKGNTFNIDKDGNGSNIPTEPAEGGKSTPSNTDGVDKSGQVTAITATGISIAFSNNDDSSNGPKSKYAFDVMPKEAPKEVQKLYKKVGNAALPYKAAVNGDTDTVLATVTVTDAKIKLDSIVFKTQNGAKVDFKRNDKTFVLTVKGSFSYAEEQILATIKQGDKWKVIGAFMLVHISPKEVNVVLVPLNKDTQIPASAEENLLSIYKTVGIKLNITRSAKVDYSDTDGKIEVGDSDFLENYTTEEQTINSKIKNAPNYKADAYYLIYSDLPASNGSDGFMALKGQFGYVFSNDKRKTAAHELGHGALGLEHPFKTKAEEKKTNFLMDYGDDTVFWHNDWKQINAPKFKLYMFQEDSEGESQAECNKKLMALHSSLISLNFLNLSKLLECERGTKNSYISNNVKYSTTTYEEVSKLKITYFPDLWKISSTAHLFLVESQDKALIEKKINKFWIYYEPNLADYEVGVNATIALKDEMPHKGEELYCYKQNVFIPKKEFIHTDIDLEKLASSKNVLIFVNGHYNKVLNAAGMAPPAGGKKYWDSFNERAEDYKLITDYLKFPQESTYIIYVDGSSMIGFDKDFRDRFNLGESYIKSFIKEIGILQDKTIAIIGHSEGVACAAGVVEELYNDKAKIQEAIYLSGDECAENGASTNTNVATYQIEFMYFNCLSTNLGYVTVEEYDKVTGTDFRYKTYSGLKGITKFGIAIENNLNSLNVHATTAWSQYFIPVLKDLKKATISQPNLNSLGETIFFHSKTDKTKFYKINDKFIISNHLQFDDITGTLNKNPCK
jgi:hypothetical protein